MSYYNNYQQNPRERPRRYNDSSSSENYFNSDSASGSNTSNAPYGSGFNTSAPEFVPQQSRSENMGQNINTGAVRKKYDKNSYSSRRKNGYNNYRQENSAPQENTPENNYNQLDYEPKQPQESKKNSNKSANKFYGYRNDARKMNNQYENHPKYNQDESYTDQPSKHDPKPEKYNNYYENKPQYKRNYDRNQFYDRGYNLSRNSSKFYTPSDQYEDFVQQTQNYDNSRYDKRSDSFYNDSYRNNVNYQKKKPQNRRNAQRDNKKALDAASQRERLVDMIMRKTLECLVCCEKIKNTDKVWSCKQCYHIMHLKCVIAWAKSSKIENGWRCPACQNVCSEVPTKYRCYCDKMVEPRSEIGLTPHSCGDVCMRKGRTCEHNCTILCHPGPCPDCNVIVTRSCGCGKTTQQVKCNTDVEIICQGKCEKKLACGLHSCEENCHSGACPPCGEKLLQECFCGKVGRKVPCDSEHKGALKYNCEETCDKLLLCGNHKCTKICHEGPCEICSNDVSIVKTCPCGKTLLKTPRVSCLDDIPCCEKTCKKVLNCGQPNLPHECQSLCHKGLCPPCPLTTVVKCRCGHMDKEMPCSKLTTKADDARCGKKCTKKRLCGKHKCNQLCCIEIEHICPLPCNHTLSCGKHKCERTCHNGRCPPCMDTSFEELYCECGASVIYPPVACGTKPPPCDKPCSRQRPCGHEVNHSCHTGPCPPCTVLCKRWCYGNHEQRAAIPCHQENFSCGLACGKEMSCKRHKCVQKCHPGPCPPKCKQPCSKTRPLCGHPCNAQCHAPPCPDVTCRQKVQVTCLCGMQKGFRNCNDVLDEFRALEMEKLKDKMGSLGSGSDHTVDLSDISKVKKPAVLKILECTEECKVLERNRRLAIGLQIRNPDISQKLTPKFSDFMRNWAKKDPHFCQRIHEKLTDLVQLAKQSKQKSRAYSFESMNRDKRHFVHEYCEHFGCDSEAYDQEPNRNIVATAIRDKSWLPSVSLLEFMQRENGQRKVPGPAVLRTGGTGPLKNESVTSLKLPGRSIQPQKSNATDIDYFNDPPV